MRKYEIEVKTFAELKDKIEIPKFQRGLVWSEPKKREFIKTLKSGLPIGVLLLSKKDDKYLVIDGLQRFTTMIDYSRNIFKYVEKSEISNSDLYSILDIFPQSRESFDKYTPSAQQLELEKMRAEIASCIANGYGKDLFDISNEAATAIKKNTAVLNPYEISNIQRPIYKIVESICKRAEIDSIEIPLIIFTGQSSELVNIFQKLNQEGVRLSKYDVFSATWVDKFVEVKDDSPFIDYIINKYNAAQNASGLEIDAYDPDELKQQGKLTVFEYAFAVGKAIIDKCKLLFPQMDTAAVDGIGFLILAELLGLTYQNMGKLADVITDKYKTVNYKRLKDCIVTSAQIVEESLKKYITYPNGTGSKRTSLVCHSELQLASYIIVVFKLKYELTPERGLIERLHRKELEQVKKFLYMHYLYDILRDHWAGSGDTKLEDIIADPITCRYTRNVDKDDFERTVSGWLEENNNKQSLMNVSAETKLFLNYLLRNSGVYDEQFSYDVEHCVPKDTLKKFFIKRGISVAVSPACNLVYIPSTENRSKGEQTYYQRQQSSPKTFVLDQDQLDAYGYPHKNELSFTNSTSTLNEKNYRKFLEERRKVLLKKFIDELYR